MSEPLTEAMIYDMIKNRPVPQEGEDPMVLSVPPPTNPWARISDVATRLGVAPCTMGKPGTITAMGADGKSYDIWEVATAFLDRMDAER